MKTVEDGNKTIIWNQFPTPPNTGQDVEQHELLITVGGNAKWYTHFGRVWWFLTKLNILSPYDLTILGI